MIDYPTVAAPSPAAALAHRLGTRAKRTRPFRTRLREHRDAQGLKLRQVAAAVGIGVSHLSSLEQGAGLNLGLALKLAAFYGKRVEDIWEVKV